MFAPRKERSIFLNEIHLLSFYLSKLFLFPFFGKTKFKQFGYYSTYFLIVFTSIQLCFTLVLTGLNDFIEIINISPNLGVCVMCAIKYAKVNSNRALYYDIFEHFREDLWKTISEYSAEDLKTITKYTKIFKLTNRTLILYLSLPLIAIVTIFPWILMVYENKVGKEQKLLLPFDGWYPFDKVNWYFVVYIWESFMTGLIILVYAITDALNISFVACICMELKLLGNSLENLINPEDIENITRRKNISRTHENIKRKLNVTIKRHTFLAKISSELNITLGDLMLVNYTFGSLFICLTAFTFTVVDDLYKSLRYFFFFIALIVAVLDQCIMGQSLSDSSEQLAEAIHASNWLYADQQTKRTLLMLLMRTQKPLQLTANGYLVMNLDTFTRICSSSYQFFNLLRTIYQP
uniref:Odorant receptor n=1 Tax=Streltzoviella insularis TaxID=1206366 RepID=A0A7D5UMP5_9NEOP|nr:odorant receptor 31 [Streltzoviella insularis]